MVGVDRCGVGMVGADTRSSKSIGMTRGWDADSLIENDQLSAALLDIETPLMVVSAHIAVIAIGEGVFAWSSLRIAQGFKWYTPDTFLAEIPVAVVKVLIEKEHLRRTKRFLFVLLLFGHSMTERTFFVHLNHTPNTTP